MPLPASSRPFLLGRGFPDPQYTQLLNRRSVTLAMFVWLLAEEVGAGVVGLHGCGFYIY